MVCQGGIQTLDSLFLLMDVWMKDFIIITSYNIKYLLKHLKKIILTFEKKPKTDNLIAITVQKDNDFPKKITEKLNHLFKVIVLPELISRKSAVENTENEKFYCLCQRPISLPMIACDGTNREI